MAWASSPNRRPGSAGRGGGGDAACRVGAPGGRRPRINTLTLWMLLLLGIYGVGRLRRRR